MNSDRSIDFAAANKLFAPKDSNIFFLIYLNEIFYFFISINIVLLLFGFFILLFILCEAYYLKAFLAMSSILNTLFVFLALNSTNISDFFLLSIFK